jgi:choline dehydrogenase-like flavoprotein
MSEVKAPDNDQKQVDLIAATIRQQLNGQKISKKNVHNLIAAAIGVTAKLTMYSGEKKKEILTKAFTTVIEETDLDQENKDELMMFVNIGTEIVYRQKKENSGCC